MRLYPFRICVALTLAVVIHFSAFSYHATTDSLLRIAQKNASDLNSDFYNRLAAKIDLPLNLRLEYANKAYNLAHSRNDKKQEVHAQIQRALIFRSYSNYSAALEEYLRVEKKCQIHHLDSLLGENYYLIGTLFKEWNQEESAAEYLEKALVILQKVNHKLAIGNCYHSLGSIMYSMKNEEQALVYWRKSIQRVKGKARMVMAPLNSIGLYYLDNEVYDSASYYFNKALALSYSISHNESNSVFHNNLGIVAYSRGQVDSAKFHFNKSMAFAVISENPKSISGAHNSLSDFYYQEKAFEMAYHHKLKEIQIKDSIFGNDTQRQVYSLLEEIALQQKELEIQTGERKFKSLKIEDQFIQWVLVFILILFVILLIAVIYLIYFYKKKVKEAKDLAFLSLEKSEESKHQSDDEASYFVNYKSKIERDWAHNSKLITNLSLDLSQRQEMVINMRERFKKMKHMGASEKEKEINDIGQLFESQFQTDKEMEGFHQSVDSENAAYTRELSNRFPTLTKNDIKLCGMLRLNRSSKDIATMNGTTIKAVEMGRYRVRKKLGLSGEQNLSDFLQSF